MRGSEIPAILLHDIPVIKPKESLTIMAAMAPQFAEKSDAPLKKLKKIKDGYISEENSRIKILTGY